MGSGDWIGYAALALMVLVLGLIVWLPIIASKKERHDRDDRDPKPPTDPE
jgi:hypothetical protein